MIDAPSRPDEAVLGVVPAPDTVFGLLALARAHVAPLVNRLWRGEGALLAVNVSIALAARPDPRTLLASVAVSTAVLVLLYMLNDVYDCHQDLHDVRSTTQSMHAVSACTSAGSTAGNIPMRSWLRPSLR